MTMKIKNIVVIDRENDIITYCPNPDECDGNCPTLKDKIHEMDIKLNNVLKFIVSFFEDDDNIQPIKKELQSVINELK